MHITTNKASTPSSSTLGSRNLFTGVSSICLNMNNHKFKCFYPHYRTKIKILYIRKSIKFYDFYDKYVGNYVRLNLNLNLIF
jgi:hypothetical protein